MTPAMKSALLWLRNRNGDGVFDKSGVLVAAGQRAGVDRSTWNKLSDAGMVEFYRKRKRVRITFDGKYLKLNDVIESVSRD